MKNKKDLAAAAALAGAAVGFGLMLYGLSLWSPASAYIAAGAGVVCLSKAVLDAFK